MSRDRANLRVDIWADRDWRNLTYGAQWLYELILTHPSLSYAGVADWRETRLAAMASDMTVELLQKFATELQDRHFIYVDMDTEEVLVRSFVRHDGIIGHNKLIVSMALAFAEISSLDIREFFAFEVQKLQREMPDVPLWGHPKLATLMKFEGRDMKELAPSQPLNIPSQDLTFSPYPAPKNPNEIPSQGLPTSTSTSTSPTDVGDGCISPNVTRAENADGKSGTRIPSDFKPTPQMLRWAQDNAPNVNVIASTRKFTAHFKSVAGRNQFKTDWPAAWEAWLLTDQERATTTGQYKTAAERKLEEGARLYAKYSALEETQQQLEGITQ